MRWFLLSLIFIVCLVIWAISPLLPSLFSYVFGEWVLTSNDSSLSLESRALFGDSFGIVNSLFSILSLVAVVFVLFQTQHRDGEKERPFVLTRPVNDELCIKITADTKDEFKVEFKLLCENHASFLAHSVVITAVLKVGSRSVGKFKKTMPRPVTGADERFSLSDAFVTSNHSDILDALSAGREVLFKVKLAYSSTSNRKFQGENTYRIALSAGAHEAINSLRRDEYNEAFWGGGKFVTCEITEVDEFAS